MTNELGKDGALAFEKYMDLKFIHPNLSTIKRDTVELLFSMTSHFSQQTVAL